MNETVLSIFEKTEVNIQEKDIIDVRRLGKKEGNRPILVSLADQKCKKEIYQKAKNFGKLSLSFANDMTREMREKKIQYNKLREAKSLLERQGKTAEIRGSKIFLDNLYYEIDELHEVLPPSQAVEPENDDDYNGDTDDSTISRVSTASRKRGRPQGSRSSLNSKRLRSTNSGKKSINISTQKNPQKIPNNLHSNFRPKPVQE